MRIVLLALLVVGCGGATVTPADPEAPFTVGNLHVVAAEGASRMESVCFEEERCDALDSDCDGTIDESCEGVRAGALDIAMAWDGSGSVTLVVDGPTEAVSNDATGECADASWARTSYRSFEALVPGTYRVSVQPTDACEAEGARTASVALAGGGQLLGIWNLSVADDAAQVVQITVGE